MLRKFMKNSENRLNFPNKTSQLSVHCITVVNIHLRIQTHFQYYVSHIQSIVNCVRNDEKSRLLESNRADYNKTYDLYCIPGISLDFSPFRSHFAYDTIFFLLLFV